MTRYRRHSARHAAYARFRGIDDRASPKAGERRVCVPIAVVDNVERRAGRSIRCGHARHPGRGVMQHTALVAAVLGVFIAILGGCSATGRRRAGCAPSSAVSTAASGVAWRRGPQHRRVRPVAGQVSDPRPRGRRRAAVVWLLLLRPLSFGNIVLVIIGPCPSHGRRSCCNGALHRPPSHHRGARTRTCAWHSDDTGAARHRRRPGPRAGLADRGAAHRVV
jgi:hypothetical protein